MIFVRYIFSGNLTSILWTERLFDRYQKGKSWSWSKHCHRGSELSEKGIFDYLFHDRNMKAIYEENGEVTGVIAGDSGLDRCSLAEAMQVLCSEHRSKALDQTIIKLRRYL